jgi:IS1 family transposase
LPAGADTLLPAQRGDPLEADELWSFVFEKAAGQCWVWVALCRRTPQVVGWTFGDRSEESCRFLMETVPESYARKPVHTDKLPSHAAALLARQHRPQEFGEGETNRVERFFLTARQKLARLVRKTLSFSKSFEMHAMFLQLFFTEYNLAILHQRSA